MAMVISHLYTTNLPSVVTFSPELLHHLPGATYSCALAPVEPITLITSTRNVCMVTGKISHLQH